MRIDSFSNVYKYGLFKKRKNNIWIKILLWWMVFEVFIFNCYLIIFILNDLYLNSWNWFLV